MACPYFFPVNPLVDSASAQRAMLPLGSMWTGSCSARPDDGWVPSEGVVHSLCNLGYARGNCAEFPCDGGPDAVRFTISHDDGSLVGLVWVWERDHHPHAHGRLEYSLERGEFTADPSGATFGRQAHAYLESYLRRKGEAGRK
ncbi:MAG TPA: hypothetical protein VKU19_31735 [Bryobacteraceae bacterium]|nr:hypothetical protein [Bryobacteraceae bacterium]